MKYTLYLNDNIICTLSQKTVSLYNPEKAVFYKFSFPRRDKILQFQYLSKIFILPMYNTTKAELIVYDTKDL